MKNVTPTRDPVDGTLSLTGTGTLGQSGEVLSAERAIASAAVLTGVPAGLLEQMVAPGTPAITVRFRLLGKRARAIETNVARLPGLFRVMPKDGVQLGLDWATEGEFAGGSVEVFAPKGRLSIRDEMLLTDVFAEFIRAGCPIDGRVPFSLGWAAEAMGYSGKGGRTVDLVKEALSRIRAVSIRSRMKLPGGFIGEGEWALATSWQAVTRGSRAGGGWIRLSPEVAGALRAGSATFLDGPTLRAIFDRDELAALLWIFLETDNGPDRVSGWRYAVFPGRQNEPARARDLPALGDLLGLGGWSHRPSVARRIAQAGKVIADVDRRYVRIAVVKAKERGLYRLEVDRTGRHKTPDWQTHERGLADTRPGTGRHTTPDWETQLERPTVVSTVVSTVGSTVVSTSSTAPGRKTDEESALHAVWKAIPYAVSKSQRKLLYDVADAHQMSQGDETSGYRWLLTQISEARRLGVDPITHVRTVHQADQARWQAEAAVQPQDAVSTGEAVAVLETLGAPAWETVGETAWRKLGETIAAERAAERAALDSTRTVISDTPSEAEENA